MNYSNVTIDQFQRLTQVVKIHDGNVFMIGANIINIFEGVSIDEVKLWTVNKLEKKMVKYSFLNDSIPEDNWVKEFTLEDKTYKVIQTPDKWNVGQFISIASLTKTPEEIISNLHLILAAMVCTNEHDVMDTSRLFKERLSIDIAYPIGLFFCAVMLKLPKSITHYLKVELQHGLD